MRNRHRVLAGIAPFLVSLVFAAGAPAQTFVKITDPANPVVNDAYQSGGACWVDLVGDGYLDLFVANGNLTNQVNTLYRNNRAGGFVRVVTGPVVTGSSPSIGGTIGDYDHDGFQDLFVTNRNSAGNLLYRGLGDTLFTRVTTGQPVTDINNSNMSSWVDVDNDGDLDLYVINFGDKDFFYVNSGAPGFTFTRIDTTACTPGFESSIPGTWADYNNDGREDLFIGNAGNQADYLFTNNGHLSFTRIVIPDGQGTLGSSWGDYDNDGDLDLYAAHYPNQANKLYRNSGAPLFEMVPVDTGIVSNEVGKWVGTSWGDYDNDGYLDLFVANDGAAGSLYHNNGAPGYGFTKVTTGVVATDTGNSFGAVWGDYDRDGQLDLFVANHMGQKNRLFHNTGNPNHWLTVRCSGTTSNRSAIGAKVHVYARINGVSRAQLREVTGQTGYNSQNMDQHFGLADAAYADSVVVEWPSGLRETWRHVLSNVFLKLTEGTATTGVGEPPDGSGALLRLEPVHPNPFQGSANIDFNLARAGFVRLEVFDVQGRLVARLVDEELPAGAHRARFTEGPGISSGLYFARLRAAGESRTIRLVLAR